MRIVKKLKTRTIRNTVFHLGGFAILWNEESVGSYGMVDLFCFAPPQIYRVNKGLIDFQWKRVRGGVR